MRINTNNKGFVEIERTKHGISVASCDEQGYVTRRDGFDEGEIIMALNLLRYMRDEDQKSVYLIDENTRNYLRNLINNGDMEEYRIFQ